MGLLHCLQPRDDTPQRPIDTAATQAVKDVWTRVRAEAIICMDAARLAPPLGRRAAAGFRESVSMHLCVPT